MSWVASLCFSLGHIIDHIIDKIFWSYQWKSSSCSRFFFLNLDNFHIMGGFLIFHLMFCIIFKLFWDGFRVDVNYLMSVQSGGLPESFSTDLAYKWLSTCMHCHVSGIVVVNLEYLSTFWTWLKPIYKLLLIFLKWECQVPSSCFFTSHIKK